MPKEERHRIGELARRSGLTVRTLHYYEEIGLMPTPDRSPAGHRLFTQSHVERLYQIALLRRLGLPLTDIGSALDDDNWSLEEALRRHTAQLADRVATESRLQRRLTSMLAAAAADKPPTTSELLELTEEMIMLDPSAQQRISFLVYADIEGAFEYLVRVFDLGPGELTRDGDGRVVHGEIQAGDGVVWMHRESKEFGLASPATLGAATGGLAVIVDDVDAHHARAKAANADIDYEPMDQPYGYREYSVRDIEGGLWSFMKPLD